MLDFGASTIGAISTLSGYIMFRIVLIALPKKLSSAHNTQKKEVLGEAKRQAESILKNARTQDKEAIEMLNEELNEEIAQLEEDLEELKNDLVDQERYIKSIQKEAEHIEKKVDKKKIEIKEQQEEIKDHQHKLSSNRQNLITQLASETEVDISSTKNQIIQSHIEARTIECQKFLKALEDNFSSEVSKNAKRTLEKVNARYAPTFYWPKHSNTVEANQKVIDYFSNEQNTILTDLSELTECTIQVAEESQTPMIRLAGGFGINREAARLAIENSIQNTGHPKWNTIESNYQNQRQLLLKEASQLGRRAVEVLKLDSIHPELQRLVGALNWRTSYRQNQWFHTVEVATLAGLLASEIGVDPDHAKRCGLLHDIGKALDYNIEGSHAVVSGDYADRYGETRLICDAVMSHHDDLIVESPLAWLLKAADTMSGARPGARVNLEEGYQIRLDAISEAANSFSEVANIAIMSGGRELHVQVHNNTKEKDVQSLPQRLAKKIEESVAYPGQIKIVVTRTFESVSVA